MGVSWDQLLGLIHQLYAAPGSQEGWHAFLEHLCTALNGSAAHFISVDVPSQRPSVSITVRTDPAILRVYNDYWGAYDPWGPGLRLREASSGSVVLGDELIPHAQLKKTAYYNDFGRSADMVRALIGTIETGPHAVSVVSINGTERRNPFETEESNLLTALMPHLRRALQLHRRLVSAEANSVDLGDAIDRAGHAILIVTAAGRVTFLNRVAERLTAARDGLIVTGGELRAARAADTTHLRSLLADAVATSTGQGVCAGGALALGRPSGRRPLLALVVPLTGRRTLFPDVVPAAAMVIVSDPERVEISDASVLAALLGLTPAEAALTRLLALGLTINDAATELGLRRETVRTRLKTIFEKTGTHSQAALVRLAVAIPPLP